MDNTILKYCLALWMLCNFAHIQAQEVQLFLENDSIMIGEQTNLKFRIMYPYHSKIDVVWPDLENRFSTEREKIEYVKSSGIDSLDIKDGGRTSVLRQVVTITSFDSGYYAIPPFRFIINNDTMMTAEKHLYVNTVSVNKNTKLHDIKDIHRRPFDWKQFIKKWIPIVLLAGLIFWLFWYLVKKINNQPEPIPEKAPTPVIIKDPAHVIAYRSLQSLKEKALLEKGKEKQYQSELTAILRTYIEDRFGIQAMEQTTAETINNLKFSSLSPQSLENIVQVLNMADIVKFAKGHLSQQLNQSAWDKVKNFVDETMRKQNIDKKDSE